jgi:polysaccharide biosynthesis protein PslG
VPICGRVIDHRRHGFKCSRTWAALLGCAVALLGGAATGASAAGDAAGIYSEELERANSADPVAVAAAMRDAHVGLVRQPFSWARVETTPGQLDFTVYDAVMAAAASAGLQVLPVVMDPPAWRSTAPATGRLRAMYPPRDPAELAAFASALARRYGPGGSFWAAHPQLAPAPIRSWQIWNEPNIQAFWATGPDPSAYIRLLDATGTAIRAVDPGAEIVAGGLPYAGNGLTPPQFIDAMYAAGGRGTFDTIAVHPYAPDPAGVLEILRSVRVQLDGLGDADRPIWATEFGWATGGPPVTITGSEPMQAKLLRDAIASMQRARDALHLRGFVAFRWQDMALNAGQTDVWALHTGLLRGDGSPKPALAAFAEGADLWRVAPTAADTASAVAALDRTAAAGPRATSVIAGISRRSLKIRRYVSRGRLVVTVAVPPGGGSGRVRIAYAAIRNGRTVFAQARRVSTRKRVARVVFRLAPSARRARELRITASHGSARATRLLPMSTARQPASSR